MTALKVVVAKPLMMLPPAPDKCQTCAVKHPPADPHNAQSLYYQMKYKMDTGNEPSWLTAMAHCTPEMKAMWISLLKEMGVDVDGGRINPSEKSTDVKKQAKGKGSKPGTAKV
jgi:hypothetical protein